MYKYDLSDVSFLIVLRVDSQDRQDNINAVIKYLNKNFITNILILEADTHGKLKSSLLPSAVMYFFSEDTGTKLHRTKYFNQLIYKSKTSYIALYDSDVIIPVHQILQSVIMLRSNFYSIVSPYGGRFINIDDKNKTLFLKSLDVNLLESKSHKFITWTTRSLGGAIFLNRKDYYEAGLENEYIKSWGPDDVERVKRMEILNFPLKRIEGNLYHLPHDRGENSMYLNNEERCALMQEYLKICTFKKHDLKKYVSSWTWIQ